MGRRKILSRAGHRAGEGSPSSEGWGRGEEWDKSVGGA